MSQLLRSHPANAHPHLSALSDSNYSYTPNRAGSYTATPKYKSQQQTEETMDVNQLKTETAESLEQANQQVSSLQQQLAEALQEQERYQQLLTTLNKFD